jgi:hypothetical protein
VEENDPEVRELRQQLVHAQTATQIELIDKKLAVLEKYQQ